MSSAARDRWEKTYGRHVDNWEKLEKQQAEKVEKTKKAEKTARTEHPPKPEPTEPAVSSLVEARTAVVKPETPVQPIEPETIDNHAVVNENPATSDENNSLIRLRVNVAPIDRIREAVKNPVHEAPVPGPSEAEIEALAAERARQAREDKLNAAIPGRKFRKQGKLKPGALTPAPGSTNHKHKHQVAGQSTGKTSNQKAQPERSASVSSVSKERSPQKIEHQPNPAQPKDKRGKDPP
jgi:hypothetical protein